LELGVNELIEVLKYCSIQTALPTVYEDLFYFIQNGVFSGIQFFKPFQKCLGLKTLLFEKILQIAKKSSKKNP
jgi:hypothetical protein